MPSQENDLKNRLWHFKNKGVDCDVMRRHRYEESVRLRKGRKAKRNDLLQKRRNITIDEPTFPLQDNNVLAKSPIMSIADILCAMQSPDEEQASRSCQAGLSGAVWALTNIVFGTSQQIRNGPSTSDHPLDSDAILGPAKLDEIQVSCMKNAAWVLRDICHSCATHMPEQFEKVEPCLPFLKDLLHFNDSDVIADVCWALSYLSSGNKKIQAVVSTGLVPRLIELLDGQEVQVLIPALRTLGNIVLGNDGQTDAVLQANVLPRLKVLLSQSRPNLVKEAAWTLSNISAGNEEQIQEVINAGLIPSLIRVLQEEGSESREAAASAVLNLISGGTIQQLSVLVREGVLQCVCALFDSLDMIDHKCAQLVMDGIVNILATAEKTGDLDKVDLLVEECNKIDVLQYRNEIHQAVDGLNIFYSFFSSEVDDHNLVPRIESKQFSFNTRPIPVRGFSF